MGHANVMVIPEFLWILLAEVGVLPERRWTNPKGVTNQTKNVPSLNLELCLTSFG